MSDALNYPRNAWYVLADSDEVVSEPLARRGLGEPVVLFRTSSDEVAALADRDAHAPYPLSLGRVESDVIVSGYSGFGYDASGQCVFVPTQDQIPVGARVRAYPVNDDGVFVWVWFGDPARAHFRPPPSLHWLSDPDWATVGESWETQAHPRLLLDNFADITHVAVVDPFIAPPALAGSTPPLEVEVSETTVSFLRRYDPAPLAEWHAELLGVPTDAVYPQRESGVFVGPGVWVDRWEVDLDQPEPATFIFSHAITPTARNRTRHSWQVSRNFALGTQASKVLQPIFSHYYRRVRSIVEIMQHTLDVDGPRREVHVSADAVVLQVRKILRQMIADEGGGRRAS